MTISLIAAIDRNRVIGKSNALPWYLPADLKHFKKITLGKPVIMGRRTFISIGRPLPDRTNIIVTDDKSFQAQGCVVVHSIEESLNAVQGHEEVMIIGGASIFKQFLPRADKMYLTLINHEFEGDIYFPKYDAGEWQEVSKEEHNPDEKNQYPFTFIVLKRIR